MDRGMRTKYGVFHGDGVGVLYGDVTGEELQIRYE
jgi:hypothetical protein